MLHVVGALVLVFAFFSIPAYASEDWVKSKLSAPVLSDGSEVQYFHRLGRVNIRQSDFLPPTSAWLAWRQNKGKKHLSAYSGNTLVLPVQVQAAGFDSPVRTVFAHQIYSHAKANMLRPIGTPELVNAAFGNARSISESEARQLAVDLGVTRIIESYAGHYIRDMDDLVFVFDVKVHERTDQETSGWRVRRSEIVRLDFDQTESPFDVFGRALASTKQTLGFTLQPDAPLKLGRAKSKLYAPDQVAQVRLASRVEQALWLQMLGAVTPKVGHSQRRELFARSLHILLGLEGKQGLLNSLLARAYTEIGLSNVAYTLLQEDSRNCYNHVLRSNLGALENCIRAREPEDLALYVMDLLQVRYASGYDFEKAEDLLLQEIPAFNSWMPFALAVASRHDPWRVGHVDWIQSELQNSYPLSRSQSISLGLQLGVASVDPWVNAQLLPIRYYRRLMERGGETFTANDDAFVYRSDLLEVLQSHALAVIYDQATIYDSQQGVGHRALGYLDRVETVLRDHPTISLKRAAAHLTLARQINDGARQLHIDEAREHAYLAYYWEQGNSYTSLAVEDLLRERKNSLFRISAPKLWRSDAPKAYWWTTEDVQKKLHSRVFEFYIYEHLAKSNKQAVEELGDYFFDHLKKRRIALNELTAARQWVPAQKLAEELLSRYPQRWDSYNDLAKIFLRQGMVEKAADTYRKYPPFKTLKETDRIEHSNYSQWVAVDLSVAGRADLGQQFYEISEAYNTGSSSSINAQVEANAYRGDFAASLRYAEKNLRRYGHAGALVNYLELLCLSGNAEPVLDMFEGYVDSQESMIAWLPAFTAQRILGWSPEEISKWLNREELAAIDRPVFAGLKHYIRSIITDRGVTELDIELIRKYNAPAFKEHKTRLTHHIQAIEEDTGVDLSDRIGEDVELLLNGNRVQGKVVAGFLETFLRIDQEVRKENFSEALALLPEIYGFDDHTSVLFSQVLLENGRGSEISKYLQNVKPEQWKMAHHLALALVDGYGSKHEDAIRQIRLAMGFAQGTGERFTFSPFEIAKTIDILWEKTSNSVYRELGVEWARNAQQVYRSHGWPYALEAKLTTDKAARRIAIDKAMFLDPRSHWLNQLPEEVLQAAQKGENPFLGGFEKTPPKPADSV